MNVTLRDQLKQLRLSGLSQSLEVRLQEAKASKLDHAEFLELILADELVVRRDRLIERRTKAAAFRDLKALDNFDFEFNTSVKRKQVYDLAAGDFVRKHHDVLLIGPPGVGKSHLAQGIGRQLIRDGFTVYYRSIFDCVRDFLHDEAFEGHDRILARYLKPDLLILDDMGMKQLKAAVEVDSPKAFQSYMSKQVEVASAVRQQMLNDFKELTEMGTHFKDDFTKLTENNVQEIKEAVNKASNKAA